MEKLQTKQAATPGLVPEQLLERERQRHEETALRKQHSNLLAEEHPDYIAHKFSELAGDIKASINESVKYFLNKSAAEIALHDECDSPQLKFATHAARISELQRYLTACTRFLPDYKIKACTQIINELNKTLDESRQQVMPKKKFGFSAKKPAKKTKIDSNIDEKEKCDPSKPINVQNSTTAAAATTVNNTTLNLNRNHVDRRDEYIFESRENVNNHDVTLVNLKNCFVELRGHPSSVRVDNLSDCVILMGPVSSSVYVENCQNCTFAIACQQLRCHNSNSCRIWLHVTCRAVMEDSQEMHFGVYKFNYDDIEKDFLAAGLDSNTNNYADIADFNWLSPHVPSPNWCLIKLDEPIDFDSLRRNFKTKLNSTNSPNVKET